MWKAVHTTQRANKSRPSEIFQRTFALLHLSKLDHLLFFRVKEVDLLSFQKCKSPPENGLDFTQHNLVGVTQEPQCVSKYFTQNYVQEVKNDNSDKIYKKKGSQFESLYHLETESYLTLAWSKCCIVDWLLTEELQCHHLVMWLFLQAQCGIVGNHQER